MSENKALAPEEQDRKKRIEAACKVWFEASQGLLRAQAESYFALVALLDANGLLGNDE